MRIYGFFDVKFTHACAQGAAICYEDGAQGLRSAVQRPAYTKPELIEESCIKQNISPGQLTVHADRGSSMKSKEVAQLLFDLGADAIFQNRSDTLLTASNQRPERFKNKLPKPPSLPEAVWIDNPQKAVKLTDPIRV